MAGIHQINKIALAAEVIVQLVKVSTPVAVVASVSVVDDGRNPDGVEAHSLDIVEVVDDSSVASSAVVA